MNRRFFLRAGAMGLAGTMVPWEFGGSVALGQVPWEDEKESVLLTSSGKLSTSPMREFQRTPPLNQGGDWPAVACARGGQLWVGHVQETSEGEQVVIRPVSPTGAFGDEVSLAPPAEGLATHLTMCAHGDGVAAAWSERRAGRWEVVVAVLGADARIDTVRLHTDAMIAWKPSIASHGDRLAVASETKRQPDAPFNVGVAVYTGSLGQEAREDFALPGERNGDSCRPAVAWARGGRSLWVAWDEAVGPGQRAVMLSDLLDRRPTAQRLTSHPAANIAPAIAVDGGDRVWVAFTSNRRGIQEWDIPRWIYIRCWWKGRLYKPVGTPPALNLDKEGTDQSFEFARLFAAPDGRIIVTGRPSHNFCMQSYRGNEWSPLYRFPVDSWGGRGQFMNGAFDLEGNFWVVRREYGANVLQRVEGIVSEKSAAPELVRDTEEAAFAGTPLVNIRRAPRRWQPLEELERIDESLQFYYGDIHGHTRMSDGVGDIDEYFYIRRDYYEDDFASLTDHDNFVRLPIYPSGWEQQKLMTEHFHAPGKFVTLFGQEYTTARYPRGVGHKCIWTTDPETPLWDHTRPATNTGPKLNREARKWNAIMAPHHTGWTGTDWENADPEVQMLAEIVSDHGVFEYMGNQPIPHRGGMRGGFLQDALARGLRIGFIGSSDAHGLIWHHRAGWRRDCYRGGLACVLAPELTRESIFDAMRRRRVFATTGIKPRLDFRVNGHLMGEEITAPHGSEVTLRVEIAAQERVRWVTVVRNNVDWYRYGGEGFTTRFTVIDDAPPEGTAWYYVRVEFDGPEMAWSSPVWVDRVDA